jgi:hypothetical protein
MTQGKRDRLSTEQRIDMWRRWKAGESLHDIGRAFGKGHGSIRFLLTQRGGIVPAACRPLTANAHSVRAGRHLTWNCIRFVDSGDSQRVATACVDSEPGGVASHAQAGIAKRGYRELWLPGVQSAPLPGKRSQNIHGASRQKRNRCQRDACLQHHQYLRPARQYRDIRWRKGRAGVEGKEQIIHEAR